MTKAPENSGTASPDLTKIVLNSLYLCLGRAIDHIEKAEGPEAASQFKSHLLEALKSGSLNMALLEDAATYDFVVKKIENLPINFSASA